MSVRSYQSPVAFKQAREQRLRASAGGGVESFGDPLFGEPDTQVTDDTRAFAGITPPRLRMLPIETHIAEKLHAYTMPRPRPNSRVKDLPDLHVLCSP